VVVRATVAPTADREGTSTEGPITFQKAGQTITFEVADNTLSTSDSPVTLTGVASSGLTVNYTSSDTSVASVNGSILTLHGPGEVIITANQPGNDNYTAATAVTATIFVSQSSQPSFEASFPGQLPTSDIDFDGIPALIEYGIGGSSSTHDSDLLPQMEADSRLIIRAVVRTNDPRLSAGAQVSTNLAAGWSGTLLPGERDTDQNGVVEGFERRIYSIDASSNNHTFMRMQFDLQSSQ
jgi:hypothetical protein